MLISKPEMKSMFHKVAELWAENKDYLSQIDSKFGDGDHGVTIGKISALIERKLSEWEDESMACLLYTSLPEHIVDALAHIRQAEVTVFQLDLPAFYP